MMHIRNNSCAAFIKITDKTKCSVMHLTYRILLQGADLNTEVVSGSAKVYDFEKALGLSNTLV